MELLYIILGWLLGILSPGIINNISYRYKREALQRAIVDELRDLKKRLVPIPFLVNSRYGNIDIKLLDWSRSQDNIKDFDMDDAFNETLAKIDAGSDNNSILKLLAVINSLSKKDNPAFGFKIITTGVLDANLMNVEIMKLPGASPRGIS